MSYWQNNNSVKWKQLCVKILRQLLKSFAMIEAKEVVRLCHNDERTVKELRDSADITPMGIQLEVNAEIFTTVNNLLSSTQSLSDRLIQDQKRLYALWRKNHS